MRGGKAPTASCARWAFGLCGVLIIIWWSTVHAVCTACDTCYVCCAAAQEALTMGIPKSALPGVSEHDSLERLQAARVRISGMMASFMSANI